MEWLAELTAKTPQAALGSECAALLTSLRLSSHYMDSHHSERRSGAGAAGAHAFMTPEDADTTWSGVSPFFSAELSDALCVCLRQAVQSTTLSSDDLRELLDCAVTLELSDAAALQSIVRQLTSREYCATCETKDLVETLRLLSLAVKRCKLQPPPLDHIFCRLPSEKALSPRDALQVLSSLVRLRKNQSAVEVGNAVSRRAVPGVSTYTVKDIVFGLEAIAILNTCHEAYAGEVLSRCTELVPTMSPKAVGDVSKYVTFLQPHRPSHNVAVSCSREIRRLLPALERRAEALLGQFSLRDARCVLRCFTEHKVRHSILFSRLTPYVSDH